MSDRVEFDIEIKFDVPEYFISAYTLTETSRQLIVMLEELNHYVLSESDVQFYVLPYEAGSFCKKLRIYATKHVLTPFVENASKQLGTAVVIGLGLMIYGSTRNDADRIIINNNGGVVQIHTDEMLEELRENKRFSSARSNYFQALESDEDVKKVSFSSANAVVEVQRDAYKKNIIQEEIVTELQETDIKELIVVAPVLEPINRQWSFKVDGAVRSFSMQDKDFLKEVENKTIQFKHGDKILAIIQTVYKLEDGERKFKKSAILRVKRFNDRVFGDQLEFDFGE
ncbi:MAG: hypothetical protein KAJ18_08440 [Candidatus Omnitrophica bacterium]|nr:hypothetical protein [Candidatus Omnitrophota bacterium]